jgi:hypothetical protein
MLLLQIDILQLDRRIAAMPQTAAQQGMKHIEAGAMLSDLHTERNAMYNTYKQVCRERLEAERAHEVRGIQHRGLTRQVIFMHSSHNSMVAADFRA